jgi:hypothetical protein
MVAILDAGMLDYDAVIRPNEAQAEDLLTVHPKSYLDNLKVGHCSYQFSNYDEHFPGVLLTCAT